MILEILISFKAPLGRIHSAVFAARCGASLVLPDPELVLRARGATTGEPGAPANRFHLGRFSLVIKLKSVFLYWF